MNILSIRNFKRQKFHVRKVKCLVRATEGKMSFWSMEMSANVPVNSKTAHPPAPGQTPGHLTFLKNFGQIPRYVASLDGQMPHPLELQRGSNPPPSRHVKATVLNFFSCVKPFIQMYIFCNKQLATVWIKICVNCNFNDNRVIC